VPESLPVVGLIAVLLLARLVYGLFANLRPLAPPALAVAAVAIILASVPLTLPDQVSRIEFTALAYAPGLAPPIAASPPDGGTTIAGDGFDLVLPARWKEVHLGIAGELARYQTDTDVLVVMRASGSALVTPDGYAENVALAWRRASTRRARAVRSSGAAVSS